MFLDEPIFVYFGIAGFCCLLITIFLGFKIQKFGFKKHKLMAIVTLSLILTHIILAIINEKL